MRGRLTAETLASDRAIAIYHYGVGRVLSSVTIVGAVGAAVRVPIGHGTAFQQVTASNHAHVRFAVVKGQARFKARPGVIYRCALKPRLTSHDV